jgi:hypothetical protein
MIRTLLIRLFGRSDTDEEADEDSRFVPSRLDESVRAAHGGGNADAAREMAQIEAKAEMLEEHHEE